MNEKEKEIADEAIEHGREATRLLKMSNQMHQAEKQGLIDERTATDSAIELNKLAIDEMEKAVELQKEFLDKQK